MATVNKIDLNGDTYDIESSALVTAQPSNPSEGATYYDTVNDVVKVYDGSNWNSVGGGGSVAFATSSTAGNVAEKEVSVPSITTLNVGQILCVQPTASATVANLTIKLNNFTAYPIRYNNGAITTTTDDVVWNQNFVSQFVFDGTYRQFVSHGYDNNTSYTQNILFDRGSFVSGSGTYAISRYIICLQKPDMTWEKITNTEEDYSVANNKTVNTHGFLLNGEMLYYSNTTVLSNGAVSSANTMYRQNSGFDIRYSMNTSGTGYTAGDYIYLVGTIGADGLFYLDATQWWTNTLPSTNDGKVYVKVGKYVSGVTITLELDHPAYYHDGTRIREYKVADNKQDKSNMVTTLSGADDNHYPTAKAVADAIQSSGGGDMLASTYDPNNIGADAFDYTNFTNTPTIPSKTSDLNNDSGFITSSYHDSTKQDTLSTQTAYTNKGTTTKVPQISTNTLGQVTSITEKNIAFPVTSVNGSTGAVTVTVPTKVSDLTNDSGYTTNTGTITSVKMNGSTVSSSGEADLGTVITSHQSIKTINNNSLVGSGNVTINEPIVSSTAPSSPTEGMIWYDTTNDKLKTYNGSSWDEAGSGTDTSNTKTFYLSSTSDTTTAQAVLDWYNAGKNPIIIYSNRAFHVRSKTTTVLSLASLTLPSSGNSYNSIYNQTINIVYSNNTATSINYDNTNTDASTFLSTSTNYSTPYTPQYNGSPATKKYVDDSVASITLPINIPVSASELSPVAADLFDYFQEHNGVGYPLINVNGKLYEYSGWTTDDDIITLEYASTEVEEGFLYRIDHVDKIRKYRFIYTDGEFTRVDTDVSWYFGGELANGCPLWTVNTSSEASVIAGTFGDMARFINKYGVSKSMGIVYDGRYYLKVHTYSTEGDYKKISFIRLYPQTSNYNSGYSRTYRPALYLYFTYDDETGYTYDHYEDIYIMVESPQVLATNVNYATPYTPQYPGSPTTKKYVDECMISTQSNNAVQSGVKFWSGTNANFNNLGTYDSNTFYLTY